MAASLAEGFGRLERELPLDDEEVEKKVQMKGERTDMRASGAEGEDVAADSGLPLAAELQAAAPAAAVNSELPAWLAAAPLPPGCEPPTVGWFASAGARGEDKMEDRVLAVQGVLGVPGATLLAVFDGHRRARTRVFVG